MLMGELIDDIEKNIMLLDTAHAPGGILAYFADGDEEIIHANQYVVELCSCSTLEEFMDYTGGTFPGFVHDVEVERVEESIWKQVQEKHGFDHVFYHILTKSGRLVSIEDYGKLVEREGERPVFYVFLVELDRQEARDWLTDLPELAHFKHVAALETIVPHGTASQPVILAFDMMGMKSYNATYGREGGDVLLKGFADVLRRHFDADACCRHAGDRFFVFAPSDGISAKVEAVFDEFAHSGIEGVLPVMAGACSFYPGDDVSTVLDRARLACDSDNTTWGSHITWFSESMRTEAEIRAYVLEHLDAAIENRWLRPYYQAIMRSSTDCVCCEEALARWVDPHHGILSPGLFIPVLERAGLLHKLDMHMIDCVLADFATKRERGVPIVPVSVNVSLRDFGDVDVAHVIVKKAFDAGISPKLLKVEFTESVATTNPDQLHAQIKILHEAGFSVWEDDFGSGYSSLNTLGEFEFDLLKLDMELIRHLSSRRSQEIVAGIVQIAHRLGISTLAEGAETPEQVEFLKSIGCVMLQGFHYTAPKPLDVIMRNALEGRGFERENSVEYEYWNAVGLFDLDSPISGSEDWCADEGRIMQFPTAIIEHRGSNWNILRANGAYKDFLIQTGGVRSDGQDVLATLTDEQVDPDFEASVTRGLQSGAWERVAGQIEYGTGMYFFTKHIASTDGADAFVNASVSSPFGTALGQYGDVPVAYAVFKAVVNEAGDGLDDLAFVFANDEYCEYVGIDQARLTDRSFLEVVGEKGKVWLPFCYRAAVLKEKVHDALYVPELDDRFVFTVAPASVEGYCSFVFASEEIHRVQMSGKVDV